MHTSHIPTEIRELSFSELLPFLEDLLADGLPTLILITPTRAAAFGMQDWLSSRCSLPNVFHYPHIAPNPSVTSVTEALNAVRDFRPHRIAALGGGSSIDLAKALSALLPLMEEPFTPDQVREAITSKRYTEIPPACEIIAIPTTAGSGSDVTHWATVWDPEQHQKLSIDKPELFPAMSLLCAELQAGMTPRLTLSTGLDALSHAMEAFWSRARNPESQLHAVSAVTGICLSLPDVLRDPGNLILRTSMMRNALSAGLAFTSTRTTACHSISYPLTMRYGIEHGFACALTLYPVAARNMAAVPEIAQLMDPFGGLDGFRAWLDETTANIQSLRLSAWHVPETGIREIAADAFTKGRMDNNPVPFTEADVRDILRTVY